MTVFYIMMGWIALMYLLCYKRATSSGYSVSLPTAVITFSIPILFVGLRSAYIDTEVYISDFKSTETGMAKVIQIWSSDEKGPMFQSLKILFKTFISENYHWYLLAIAVVSTWFVLKTLKEYSVNFFFSSYLFITSLFITWTMNGIRQFLAVAIIFAASKYIEKGQIIKYAIIVLFACSIHSTAIIMIPIYWVVRGKPWSFRVLLAVVATIVIITYISQFTDLLSTMLEDTKYAGSTMQFAEDDGVNPLRVLFALIPVVMSLIYSLYIKVRHPKYIEIMINMSVLTTAMYAIGAYTSGILIGRLPIYTEVYNMILIPYLINNTFDKKSRELVYCVLGLVYFLYFYLQMRGTVYVSDILGTFH